MQGLLTQIVGPHPAVRISDPIGLEQSARLCISRDFPGGAVVVFPLQGACVRSLVGELDPTYRGQKGKKTLVQRSSKVMPMLGDHSLRNTALTFLGSWAS